MPTDIVKFVLEMSDKATPKLKVAEHQLKEVSKQARNVEISLGAVGTALKIGAAALTTASAGFAAVGVGAIKAGSQMEGFETRLTVLMGSTADAKERLDELFKIGSTTPFQLPGLIEAEVNLRALGVNAEKTLPMVMDFAGAMGVDLASAAVEVGRAMQFGAGAVETISGRALRAQVELRTGADALKMSTDEFREAMIATLTDKDGIFAGGTQKLASTFGGLVSNLQDAFFKFQKQVSEAGVFKVAKETVIEILRVIDQNQDAVLVLARVVSEGLSKALLGSVKLMGKMFDMALALGAAFLDIGRKWTELVIGLGEAANIIGMGPSKEEMGALKARLDTLTETKDALLDMGGAATAAEDMVARIEANVAKIEKKPVGTRTKKKEEDEDDRKGIDPKIIAERQKAFDSAASAFASQLERIQDALRGPETKSQEMRRSLAELTASFELAKAQAMKLGATSGEEFRAMAEEYEETAARMRRSIVEQRAFEIAEAKQARMDELSGQISGAAGAITGGPGAMLGAVGGQLGGVAGPIVASIQGLAAIGAMGAERFKEDLKEFINNVVVGLVEVLPEIVGEIPLALIDAFPDILKGALEAIPKMLLKFSLELPLAIAKGSIQALKEIWETVKKWLGNALEKLSPKGVVKGLGSGFKSVVGSIGSVLGFQTGGFVRNTGLHMLHAGERVLPTSGASTQAMFAGAENIGGGQAVTINTSVVDPNAIDGLARMLQRELGNFGGGRDLDVFNVPAASAG